MSKTKKLSKVLALVIMLALVIGVLPLGAMATTYNNIEIQFGDPFSDPTWPETQMSLQEVENTPNTYTAVYNNNPSSTYYPGIVSLYAFYDQNNGVTLTSNDTTSIQFVTFDQYGSETVDADGVMNYNQNSNWNPDANNGAGAMVNSNLFAIKINAAGSITITNTDNDSVAIIFQNPRSASASAGSNPASVCGYLPVGQFARPNSFGWGTIFTDGTNIYGASKTAKFTGGYEATGVSLGMLGGFVQFEFANPIGNDADNPYGIDFIVYGNAFIGNPEAGSVMVYGKNTATDQYGWYNLAGSLHYASGTQWNVNVSYIKIASDNTTIGTRTFAKKGVYYSTNFAPPASDNASNVNAAISTASWFAIPNISTVNYPVTSANTTGTSPYHTVSYGYWPERESNENYKYVWKMWKSSDGSTDNHVDGVYWFTSGNAPVITYKGVTMVQDDDVVLTNEANVTQAMMTDVYRWGYADVRENGTNYGVAVNPYATAPSASVGGDGFDLSWAVDTEGKPVTLTDVMFVRVYSAVLFNAGVFGETSTEVCGVYVASGINSDSVVNPTVTIGNDSFTVADMDQIGRNVYLLEYGIGNGSNIVVSNYSSANVFINGSNQYSYSSTSSNPIQIIVQNGDAEPVIIVIT